MKTLTKVGEIIQSHQALLLGFIAQELAREPSDEDVAFYGDVLVASKELPAFGDSIMEAFWVDWNEPYTTAYMEWTRQFDRDVTKLGGFERFVLAESVELANKAFSIQVKSIASPMIEDRLATIAAEAGISLQEMNQRYEEILARKIAEREEGEGGEYH
jgi:hypothetical protein